MSTLIYSANHPWGHEPIIAKKENEDRRTMSSSTERVHFQTSDEPQDATTRPETTQRRDGPYRSYTDYKIDEDCVGEERTEGGHARPHVSKLSP